MLNDDEQLLKLTHPTVTFDVVSDGNETFVISHDLTDKFIKQRIRESNRMNKVCVFTVSQDCPILMSKEVFEILQQA